MLYPTNLLCLGSLFLGPLLSAWTYSSSEGMAVSSEDGSTYAKSVRQNGNLSMALAKNGKKGTYRSLRPLLRFGKRWI